LKNIEVIWRHKLTVIVIRLQRLSQSSQNRVPKLSSNQNYGLTRPSISLHSKGNKVPIVAISPSEKRDAMESFLVEFACSSLATTCFHRIGYQKLLTLK
jgi:hypothetical protein